MTDRREESKETVGTEKNGLEIYDLTRSREGNRDEKSKISQRTPLKFEVHGRYRPVLTDLQVVCVKG